MKLIPFGEFRPDVADINGNHTRVIDNVLPRGDGYGPVRDLAAYSVALGAVCRGAFRALNSDGSITVFAATATALYIMDNEDLSWSNVSKAAGDNLNLSGALASAYFGNMNGGGGNDEAFDGSNNEGAGVNTCSINNVAAAYVGVTFATKTAVKGAEIYGGNDTGFVTTENPTVTITLRAQVGGSAPANVTQAQANGVVIGTITPFTDTANESAGRVYTMSDTNTEYDHVWAVITHSGTASENTIVAELEITGPASYALPSDGIWQWAQYDDFVITVQGGDAPQVFELGASDNFANLAGSPPISKYISIVNEFVVLSGLVSFPYRSQWSGRSAPTTWTSGVSESDFQDFVDGGPTGPLGGGESSAIQLQAYAMRRMTYQPGNPVIFSFERISDEVGILAPYSLVRSGQRLFFLSNSGFQMSVDGNIPTPIGKERVDSFFNDHWDDDQMQLTIGFSDPKGTRLFIAYRAAGTEEAVFNRILCYDWVLDRWTPISGIVGEFVTSLAQVGQTLEGLDEISTDLDALEVSSLDAFPVAFGREIAVFNSAHEMGFLTGDNLEATLETPEQGEAAQQQFISGHRPISDAPSVFGQVSSRQNMSAARTWNTEAECDAAGLVPARVDTRYARHRNRIPAGTVWTYSSGVVPQSVPTGNR